MLIQRLRTAMGHYSGTAVEVLLSGAIARIEQMESENERLRGLLTAAQDVLGGAIMLSPREHDLFMELLGLAVADKLSDSPLYSSDKTSAQNHRD